jgi:hypothetical protein
MSHPGVGIKGFPAINNLDYFIDKSVKSNCHGKPGRIKVLQALI